MLWHRLMMHHRIIVIYVASGAVLTKTARLSARQMPIKELESVIITNMDR
jgi:hypothetical protein